MMQQPATTILVVTDHGVPEPQLLDLLTRRAADGPIDVTVLRTNPARAELSLLHPERHPQAHAAAVELEGQRPSYELATGRPVEVEVSVRHDAFEAVEEHLLARQVSEIVLSVHEEGRLVHRLHHDLAHRMANLGPRVTSLSEWAHLPAR